MNTSIGPRSSGRTWRRLAGATSLGALTLVSAMATADAQTTTRRMQRDSVSQRDLERRRDMLLERLDSLRREFDEDALSPRERAQLSQQMTSLVNSVAALAMRTAEWGTQFGLEMARANEGFAWTGGTFNTHINADVLPRGWIGINVDAPQMNQVRGNAFYVRYFEYPEIVSVEPNSPAERAGIAAGDVLLSYNGDDVRKRAINITRLLEPNNRVTVMVRRDGDPRSFALRVATAPMQFRERRLLPAGAIPTPPKPPRTPEMPPMPAMPAIEMQSMLDRSMDAATAPIAGARLVDIRNADLARALGAETGVLVVDVAAPAETSGLRGGDVIRRCEGESATSVRELRRIVERHASDGEITCDIMRSRHEQKVTLRW